MSEATINNASGPGPGPAPGTRRAFTPRRSFVRQVADDVLARWGARLGLIWVAVLVLMAVFAPFLANSHPLAMKAAGHWSSPALRHLTPADVSLLAVAFTAVVLLFVRRVRPGRRAQWLLAAVVVSVVLAGLFVKPPELVVYEKYREDAAAGKIEAVIYAPIPYSPADHLRDQPQLRLTAPTGGHLMGVTLDGADLLTNMIYASRTALSIGFISTGIAVVIGIIVGGLMGYYSGWVDLIGMRLVEIFSAIPTFLLLLSFVAAFGDNPYVPRLYIIMAIIGATGWVGDAVFVRAEFLRLREQDFVQAAKACGLPLGSILFRHILPNGIAPVLVSASFGVAGAIFIESTLSFLGIGLLDEASWGRLLNQALGVGGFYWWIALYPGLAIFLTVFAYNLIGEALRDAIDPHLQRAAQI